MTATQTQPDASGTFPDEISLEKLHDFVRSLGFEPEQTLGLTIDAREVVITTYLPHPERGGPYCPEGGQWRTPGDRRPDGIATVTTRLRVVG